MKLLITGFDPFGGEQINPSIEAVKRLPDVICGAQIIKLEVPTEKTRSLPVIESAILEHDPDMILSVGQAGGRADITVERVGLNVDDYRQRSLPCLIQTREFLSAEYNPPSS